MARGDAFLASPRENYSERLLPDAATLHIWENVESNSVSSRSIFTL